MKIYSNKLKVKRFLPLVLSLTVTILTLGLNSGLRAENTAESDRIFVANPCYDIAAKPFRTFSKFGYNTKENFFFKVKGNVEQKLQIPDKLIANYETGGGIKAIDPIHTLNNFLNKENITLENCLLPTDQASEEKKSSTNGPHAGNGTDTSGGMTPPGSSDSQASGNPGSTSGSTGGNGRGGKNTSPESCHLKGGADSFVLAMSWQPGFCITKPDKTECKEPSFTTPDVYSSNNFSLHGLWPNKKECGQNFGFCSDVKEQKSFSDYPEVALKPDTLTSLSQVMPSIKANSHLERHEWYKHGTCQELTSDAYFTLAGKLVEEFNKSSFMSYIRDNINKKINIEVFKKKIDAEDGLGTGASSSIIIVCKKNKGKVDGPFLVEIQFNLKSNLTPKSKLKDALDREARGYVRGCGDKPANDDTNTVNITPYLRAS